MAHDGQHIIVQHRHRRLGLDTLMRMQNNDIAQARTRAGEIKVALLEGKRQSVPGGQVAERESGNPD